MMMPKKNIISIILLVISQILTAQEVEFSISAPTQVENGQRFAVTYTVNAQGDNFRSPDFQNFRYLSGPNNSSSSSMQIINGNVTRSYSNSYTFYLQAEKEGEFKIPAARITIDGEEYSSGEAKIRVVKSSGNAGRSNSPQQNRRSTPSGSADINEDDIFIRAITENKNPYQGEEIVVTYKLYTQLAARSPRISKAPSFPGFWSVDLREREDQLTQSREIYNGKQYVTAVLDKVALFPQKSGKLTIDPMELDIAIQVQARRSRNMDSFMDRFFDDPFFGGYDYVEKTLKSNELTIDVKPLPLSNKPADFSGAVGSFNIKSEVDKTNLKTNEPLNLKITVTGKGNIDLIEKPQISFPPDFEVYDPKVSSSINKTQSGISGSRTFEYLIIPRNPGEFKIEAVNFSYFDLASGKYVNLKTMEYSISVERGDEEYAAGAYIGANRDEVQYIGSDIRHIVTGQIQLKKTNDFLWGSVSFWLLILIPLALAVIIVILYKQNRKKRQDESFVKNRKATKVARRNLKKAKEYLDKKQKEAFYIEISQALWGYLSNKFNIPRSQLSMDSVHDTLSGKDISEETIDQFINTLNETEYARFAPGDSSERMADIYQQALEMISKIERELK